MERLIISASIELGVNKIRTYFYILNARVDSTPCLLYSLIFFIEISISDAPEQQRSLSVRWTAEDTLVVKNHFEKFLRQPTGCLPSKYR